MGVRQNIGPVKRTLKILVPCPGARVPCARGGRVYLVPASCARGVPAILVPPDSDPRGPIWPIYSCAGPCAGPCAIPVPKSRTQT